MTAATSNGKGLPERGLRPASELAADKPHGVRVRYMAGCRCRPCRMANTNYETMRAKARKAGDWNGVIDARDARARLRGLLRSGIGLRTISDATGIARSTLAGIRAGFKTQVRARTYRKIMAVTAACRADHATLPAGKTWMLIDQLLEEGYTKKYLSEQLGYTGYLQFSKHRVTIRTVADVVTLHQRLTT